MFLSKTSLLSYQVGLGVAAMMALSTSPAFAQGMPISKQVHPQTVHTGNVHTGNVHTGSVHTASTHTGNVHTGLVHPVPGTVIVDRFPKGNPGMVHTIPIDPGPVHPGPVHPGPVHPGPAHRDHDRRDHDRRDHDLVNIRVTNTTTTNTTNTTTTNTNTNILAANTPAPNITVPYVPVLQLPDNPYVPVPQQSDNPYVPVPQQTERYLRVSNQTGQDLTVYVQLPGADRPLTYEFRKDQMANLAVNDVPLSASQVKIWAETNTAKWNDNKDKSLVLVAAPYQADSLDTYTHTFSR